MTSSRALLFIVVIAATAPSCTLALSYPSGLVEGDAVLCHDGVDNDYDDRIDCADSDCDAFCVENTRALCRNGIDDDLSGATDCADPSCAGLCAEESRAECSDAIDQDGDGLVDLADPSCWPDAMTATERCIMQAGVDWTATLAPATDVWSATHGSPAYVIDPTGQHPNPVLAIPPGAPPGAVSRLTNATLVTGALEGMTATASIYLPNTGVEILVQLLSPTSPPPGAPSEITAAIGGGAIEGWTIVDGAPYDGFRRELHVAGWYDVTLTMQADQLHITLTAADGTMTALDLRHPTGLSSQAAMQFAVSQTTGSTGGLLGAASLRRDNVYPCGSDVVVPPTNALESADARNVLSVASNGTGALCVLAVVGNRVASFRSDDAGRTFGPASVIPLVVTGGSQNPCASIAWDAERATFAGVGWTFAGTDVGYAGALTSADCGTWVVDAAPQLADMTHECRDYSIVRARDGSGTTHELWRSGAGSIGDLAFLRTWSTVPFGSDTMFTDDPLFAIPNSAALVSPVGHQAVHVYPADLLVVAGIAGSMHTFVIDRDVLHARDWLVEGPSHTEGSCDASALSFPALYLDGPSQGGVAYSCGTGGFFEGSPTVVRTFAVTIPGMTP